jgi:hypothetical protein
MSVPKVYTFLNAGTIFVAVEVLVGMDIDETLVSKAMVIDRLTALCGIDAEVHLRLVQAGGGHDFLSVVAELRDLPDHRDTILSILCPGKRLPELPTYIVNGCDGSWVTATDLARCTSSLCGLTVRPCCAASMHGH